MTANTMDRRPYVTVTCEFFDHPKTLNLSEPAQLHIIRLWAYCGRYKTDGHIPDAMLKTRGPKVAKELVNGGWVEPHTDGGWVCHDYLRHQPSREQIEDRQAAKAEGRARGGTVGMHRRWHVDRGVFEETCDLCQAALDTTG